MFLKILKSEGLAHNSYLVGEGDAAAVVDPSRDVQRYLDAASEKGAAIKLIFETHRNEDYISGAKELSERTGATVWRGVSPDYDVPYAQTVTEKQQFDLGTVRLWTLSTPGHTDDSISIAFAHRETGDSAIGVFTGDALFVGDVGRTDFYPERRQEVAGLLFDSLHRKLLPLGDQVAVYPAHGTGSVCGAGIAKREFTTLGYERRHNPRLQLDREQFIRAKVAEHHYIPPYFQRMEAANQGDEPELGSLPTCLPLTAREVLEGQGKGTQVLDLRNDQGLASAFIPKALGIPLDMVSSFGGWFLDYGRPIILVLDREQDRSKALHLLARIGYDNVVGFLAKGLEAWTVAAQPVETIGGIDVHGLRELLSVRGNDLILLDVRAKDEFEEGYIESARHVYVGEIEKRAGELPNGPVITYCATGRRALVAAAALKRVGRADVRVCWGSMKAWKAAGFPVKQGVG